MLERRPVKFQKKRNQKASAEQFEQWKKEKDKILQKTWNEKKEKEKEREKEEKMKEKEKEKLSEAVSFEIGSLESSTESIRKS